MNRDKIRERIRNGSIRDPVRAADGPPIYHATRSNGKPLRVAYYRHVKSDHLDTSIYYELETHCARQWISARTDWDLKGVFLDTNGSWAAYEEMKAGKYDLIVARTISSFGRIFSDAAERIATLPFPVFFEAEGILSSDEKYQVIVNELIAEDMKRIPAAYLKDAPHRSEVITA